MNNATIFENFTRVKEQASFKAIFERFGNGYYKNVIDPIREMLARGDKEGFEKAKKKLDAVTFCASHEGGRDKAHRTGYNAVIVGDVDHIPQGDMDRIRQQIISSDRTFALFKSPSGQGLKFLVRVNSGPEDHLLAFNTVIAYYELIIGFKIDQSGKDISRLCYVTYDPDIYVNFDAGIFDVYAGNREKNRQPERDCKVVNTDNAAEQVRVGRKLPLDNDPVLDSAGDNGVDEDGRPPSLPVQIRESVFGMYTRCIKYTERYYQFIEGQRNTFIYRLARNLCRAGMTESLTLSFLLQDYNYDDREVRNSVRSAYSKGFTDPLPGQNAGFEPEWDMNPVPQKDQTVRESDDGYKEDRAQKTVTLDGAPAYHNGDNHPANAASLTAQPTKKKKGIKPQYSLKEVENFIRENYETRLNIITGKLEWRFAHTNTPFSEMDDVVVNTLFCNLHRSEQYIPFNTLYLLLHSNFSPPINPFAEYFDNIPQWDGVTDYIGQMIATVRTHDDEHWDKCFRKWIVAFAAGMIINNVINHTVLVLIGDQGIGKTTWIRRLLPETLSDYLGTSTVLNDSKDTAIQLSECGMILLDEIESLTKKELAALKEYLTRYSVHIRKPYAHFSVNLVRRASVVCSLNREDLLTDTTGSRRFLCFKVHEIDYEHQVNIDGVMAQALALYNSGFRYWLNKSDIKMLNEHNERFYAKSVEQEMIETWLRPVTQEEWNNRNKFASDSNIKLLSSTQIAGEIMTKIHVTITDFSINKIGRILIKLGYQCISRHSKSLYMVRILDGETVAANNRNLDNIASPKQSPDEKKEDDQYLRFEEDLTGELPDDDNPF